MWSLVMFDLPVLTKSQRQAAVRFRNLLLDLAYQRVQLSVYVRFSPTPSSLAPAIRRIKGNLPEGGEVRIISISDHQWAGAFRFSDVEHGLPSEVPTQLTIF
jgi:CRISPR-associated protein Cas2